MEKTAHPEAEQEATHDRRKELIRLLVKENRSTLGAKGHRVEQALIKLVVISEFKKQDMKAIIADLAHPLARLEHARLRPNEDEDRKELNEALAQLLRIRERLYLHEELLP